MSDESDFIALLTTDPDVRKINFKFLTYKIYPEGYFRDVASCIKSGSIKINRRFSDLGFGDTGGSYFPANDKYSISKAFDLTKMSNKILLMHESTHALQDYQRLGKIKRAEGEAVAYVAEAIYGQAKGLAPLSDPATGLPHPIRVAADKAAKAVLGGKYEVDKALAAAVTVEVARSSHYGSLPPFMDFDGIG